jgi:hypothetical protein
MYLMLLVFFERERTNMKRRKFIYISINKWKKKREEKKGIYVFW